LSLALALRRSHIKISRGNISLLGFSGLVIFFHLLVQVSGMRFTTATNTAWIVSTSPVFVAFLSYLFLKEKLTWLKLSGILLAGLGVIFLVSKGELGNIKFISSRGDLLVLLSSLTWAIYSITSKKLLETYSATLITLYSLLLVCILVLPFNLNQKSFASIIGLSKTGWLAILYLGIFCSGIAYLFWSKALKQQDATKVSVYLYLEPLVALFGAGLILKEAITLWTVLGGVLIILGVYVVSIKKGLITVG